MIELAPSILSADFNNLGKDIKTAEDAGCRILHIDVMDGMFVPSISFGMPLIKSIRKGTSLKFDVHLMIDRPQRYIQEFAECGSDTLLIHYEACDELSGTIARIKEYGMRAGVVINPETKVSDIKYVLNEVDEVLVMTVHPGFGGQTMLTDQLSKVKELSDYRKERNLQFAIEIDGGVNFSNIETACASGVDVIVAGTAVFSGDEAENIKKLMEIMNKYESYGDILRRNI